MALVDHWRDLACPWNKVGNREKFSAQQWAHLTDIYEDNWPLCCGQIIKGDAVAHCVCPVWGYNEPSAGPQTLSHLSCFSHPCLACPFCFGTPPPTEDLCFVAVLIPW